MTRQNVPMIRGMKFASIPVTDQDRALAFYTEKLGFRLLTDQPFNDQQRWLELGIPGAETKVVLFRFDGGVQPGHFLRVDGEHALQRGEREAGTQIGRASCRERV